MFFDHRTQHLQQMESYLSVTAIPLQFLANAPAEFIQWISASARSQHQILIENARLRAQQLLIEAKLQRVISLESENAQLRALLQSSPHVGGKFTAAQLLAVDMDPFVQKVILNKGSRDNIYRGQPVLDAYGVMGQVVEVGPYTSQVLLITDIQNAVPVQNIRNGVRAVAVGMGDSGALQLASVPDTIDVQVGDVFVTSGLGQRYPAGYPVGTVKSVSRDPESRFAAIILQPSAHIDRGREVLLVWPNNPVTEQVPSQTSATPVATPVSSSAKKVPSKKKVGTE